MLLAIPILAAGDAIVGLIVLVVMAVGWIFQQLAGKTVTPQPPVQRPGKPVRVRNDRQQDEIDIFLQEVNPQQAQAARAEATRRKRPPAPPTPPAPKSPPKRRSPGDEIASRRPPVDSNLGRGIKTQVKEYMGDNSLASKVNQDLAARVGDTVTSHLGTFSGGSKTPTSAATAKVQRGKVHRLKQLFYHPENLRQAILINAILSPPKSLAKDGLRGPN